MADINLEGYIYEFKQNQFFKCIGNNGKYGIFQNIISKKIIQKNKKDVIDEYYPIDENLMIYYINQLNYYPYYII